MSLEKYRPTIENTLTVPNALSLAGLALVCRGAKDIKTAKGVSQIIAGRTLDLADGAVARTLNQSSDFGAAVDATFDKIGVLALAAEAYSQDVAPKPFIGALAIRHTLNAASSVYVALQDTEEGLRPTKSGKISMALDNLAFFGYLISSVAENEELTSEKTIKKIKLASNLVATTGLAIGAVSTAEYIKRAKNSKRVIE